MALINQLMYVLEETTYYTLRKKVIGVRFVSYSRFLFIMSSSHHKFSQTFRNMDNVPRKVTKLQSF